MDSPPFVKQERLSDGITPVLRCPPLTSPSTPLTRLVSARGSAPLRGGEGQGLTDSPRRARSHSARKGQSGPCWPFPIGRVIALTFALRLGLRLLAPQRPPSLGVPVELERNFTLSYGSRGFGSFWPLGFRFSVPDRPWKGAKRRMAPWCRVTTLDPERFPA